MTLIPRSNAKRVYALFASIPALICYLAILAYMHIGHLRPLADAVLVTSVLIITAVLTILMTKIKIAWWLRRKRLALARLAVVLVSMFISTLIVLLLATT